MTQKRFRSASILVATFLFGGCNAGLIDLDPGRGDNPDNDWALRSATLPRTGCVSKPADFEIALPFPAGENVYVTSGYGPGGGSSKHWNCENTNFAMDGQALDFTLPDHPNNGLGQPVAAVAGGTVVKAGWSDAGWRNYGIRVYIRHDYSADGHTYISLYAHLNAVYVQAGDHVDKGTIIGELGASCTPDDEDESPPDSDGNPDQPTLNCPYFGPHLHFALHRDSTVGGSGDGGSYGGQGVVPEPIDGYTGLTRGMTLLSGNSSDPPPPPPPDCPEGDGLYCGGEVNLDPNMLYRCQQGQFSVEQQCPNGCEAVAGPQDRCCPQNPDPDPDPDPDPVNCPYGDGLYCGTTLGLDADTLYNCQNGTATVVEQCAQGCHIAPPGEQDYCEPNEPPPPDPAACPYGNGLYCGPTLNLDADTLYDCRNGTATAVEQCADGCHIAPPGEQDYCEPSWVGTCPYGNGRYCGGTLGLNGDTLYDCQNGYASAVEHCTNGCHVAPPGFNDYCN